MLGTVSHITIAPQIPKSLKRQRCVCIPSAGKIDVPSDAAAGFDPDGLYSQLPSPALGGHFARREARSSPNNTITATPPTPPPIDVPSLLKPKKLSQSILDRGIGTGPAAALPPPTQPSSSSSSPGSKIENVFLDTFTGPLAAPRVLESFRRIRFGSEFQKHWPGLGLQKAESYVEGLSAEPFPDPYSGRYPWLLAVEENASIIQQEFQEMNANVEALKSKGSNVWVPAARKEAVAYGPNWRTLVLQDRGIWDEANSKLFPRTKKIFMDLNAPTLEVFFARQEAKTGIKTHTDGANFIQTSHLGLVIPEGDCWMIAGDHKRSWQNGKVFVCDTSFMHETYNDTDNDRFVLIMRHWHPEMSVVEQVAAQFLFDCLDDSTPAGFRAAQKSANKKIREAAMNIGGRRGKKVKKSASKVRSGGGFGK